MKYKCDKCNKIFDHKTHYNLHLRRKTPCKKNIIEQKNIIKIEETNNGYRITIDGYPITIVNKDICNESSIIKKDDNNPDITFINSKTNGFKCLICNKIYKHSQNLYVHKKNKHPTYMNEVKQLIEDKQLKQIKNNNQQIAHNINNGTVNNKTINNIIIGFGKEDIMKMTDDDKYHVLNERGVNPIESLIEWSHFNTKIPEQRNIKYSNINSKYAEIHDGTHWFKQLTNIVVNELIDNHTDNLSQLVKKYDKNYKMKKSVTNILTQFSDFCNNENIDCDDLKHMSHNEQKHVKDIKEFINQTKDEIKLFIHNKTIELKNKNLLD